MGSTVELWESHFRNDGNVFTLDEIQEAQMVMPATPPVRNEADIFTWDELFEADQLMPAAPDPVYDEGEIFTVEEFLEAQNQSLDLPAPAPGRNENVVELDNTVDAAQAGPSQGRRPWPVLEPGHKKGVGVRAGDGKSWEAHIWLSDVDIEREKSKKGMQCFLGSFATEEEAKRAHDKAAIILDVRVSKNGTLYSLNYPEKEYADFIAEHAQSSRRAVLWEIRRESLGKFSKGECALKGVKRKKSGKPGYTATIALTSQVDGKSKKTTMSIGHFATEEDAGREYDRALLFIKGTHDLGCITNFQPESYTATEIERVGRKLASCHPEIDFSGLKRKRSGVFG